MEGKIVVNSFEDLKVWEQGVDIADMVLGIVERYIQPHLYGFASQMQRSSVSIPSNIAEGNSRQYTKEYIQFCYISMGSCAELLTQIIIAKRRNYLSEEEFNKLKVLLDTERKMLLGLIKSLKGRKKGL